MHNGIANTPSQDQIQNYMEKFRNLVIAEGRQEDVSELDYRRVESCLRRFPPESIDHESSRMGLRAMALDAAEEYTHQHLLLGDFIYKNNGEMLRDNASGKWNQPITIDDYDPEKWRRYLSRQSRAWLGSYAKNGHEDMDPAEVTAHLSVTSNEICVQSILKDTSDPLGLKVSGFIDRLAPIDNLEIDRYLQALNHLIEAEGRMDVEDGRAQERTREAVKMRRTRFTEEVARMEYRAALLDAVCAMEERKAGEGFDATQWRQQISREENRTLEQSGVFPPAPPPREFLDDLERMTSPETVDQLLFVSPKASARTIRSEDIIPSTQKAGHVGAHAAACLSRNAASQPSEAQGKK